MPRIRKAMADHARSCRWPMWAMWSICGERLAAEQIRVDLGSDQTSLHNPWAGGYYPVGLSYEASNKMMAEEPARFRECVQESLRRQVKAINKLAAQGMYFFDYGNAFLLEASRAGAEVMGEGGRFRYPSYVQDIMGPMFFDYGFGPFRWVCASGKPEDLELTDRLAAEVLEEIRRTAPADIAGQLDDNIHWIREAGRNKLVVGSRRPASSMPIRRAARRSRSRSTKPSATAACRVPSCWAATTTTCRAPTRRTARPRTSTTARTSRPTWPCTTSSSAMRSAAPRGSRSIHNGGGVGWGEVINGGFGMVIDGTEDSARHIREMLLWDVNNGIARRSWARNEGAVEAIRREMERTPGLRVTLPNFADEALVRKALEE